MTREVREGIDISFATGENPFPYAPRIIRNFLQQSIAEGAGSLPYYRPPRFTVARWNRAGIITMLYYSTPPEVRYAQIAELIGVEGPHKGYIVSLAIKELIVLLYRNSSTLTCEPIDILRRTRGGLPLQKIFSNK